MTKERTYGFEIKDRGNNKKSIMVEVWPCKFSYPLVLDGEGNPTFPWIGLTKESGMFIDRRDSFTLSDSRYMDKLEKGAKSAVINYLSRKYKKESVPQHYWWMD